MIIMDAEDDHDAADDDYDDDDHDDEDAAS